MFTFLAIGPMQIILILVAILMPLIAVIDILRHEFTGNNKVIWLLIVMFTNLFGLLLYLAIGRKQIISKK